MTYVTRFAPSPTGPLHLGHAFSAITAADRSKANDGTFLLRIEDIDHSRCKAEWEEQIYSDLRWLGIYWPEPVMRQSDRISSYREALDRLIEMGVCYPCRCSRRDIRAALSAPQEATRSEVNGGQVYPGTCQGRSMSEADPGDAIRLDIASAFELAKRLPSTANRTQGSDGSLTSYSLAFTEVGPVHPGTHRIEMERFRNRIGDIVLARRDIGTSYHLAVVVDDAAQDISEVVRGEDLFEVTFIHNLLQDLLTLPRPNYYHHSLIRDEMGKRLAKRDDSRSLAIYRADGLSPDDIRRMIMQ